MFDGAISKLSDKFGKKTVCSVKKAIVNDIHENAHEYALAIGLGVLFIFGINKLINLNKTADVVERTVNITYNYYINTK